MRIIDLSQPLGPNTTPWPGQEPFRATVEATVATAGYYIRRLDLSEHTGTHFDAPAHFAADGATVDQVPLESLVVPARLVDVAEFTLTDPDYAVSAEDVMAIEVEHGPLLPGDALIVRTGWDRHLGDGPRYVGK